MRVKPFLSAISKNILKFLKHTIHFFKTHHNIELLALGVAIVSLLATFIVSSKVYNSYQKTSLLLASAENNVQAENYTLALTDYNQAQNILKSSPLQFGSPSNIQDKINQTKKLQDSHKHFLSGIDELNNKDFTASINDLQKVVPQDGAYALANLKLKQASSQKSLDDQAVKSFNDYYQQALTFLSKSDYQNALITANQGLALVNEDVPIDKAKVVDISTKRDQAKQGVLNQQLKAQQQVVGGIHVPILMYHYIRVNPVATDQVGFNLSVTPSDFEQQMQYLATQGYNGTDAYTVARALVKQLSLPSKPVVITFDDGYRDFYTYAFPILKKYNLHAEIYIITGFVGGDNYMTWDMLKEIRDSGLVTIGSHTVNHLYLTSFPWDQVQNQLTSSKQTLESILGITITDFCYPYGAVNNDVAAAVKNAGYIDATTTAFGNNHYPGEDLAMPRVRVGGGESLGSFIGNL